RIDGNSRSGVPARGEVRPMEVSRSAFHEHGRTSPERGPPRPGAARSTSTARSRDPAPHAESDGEERERGHIGEEADPALEQPAGDPAADVGHEHRGEAARRPSRALAALADLAVLLAPE